MVKDWEKNLCNIQQKMEGTIRAWSVIELSPVSINAWELENMEQKY